jgi:dTMP kinase
VDSPAWTDPVGIDEPGFVRGRGSQYEFELTGAEPPDISAYPGRLICVEGTDGAGRSTQVGLLREELEDRGYGVVHTAMARAGLTSNGLKQAKEGHTLGTATMDLFYATDLADRLATSVLPALRAGFVIFTDRYVYSAMARSIVRGTDPAWIEDVYRFAPKPHATFYLDLDVHHLVPRVLSRGGFDYWESGRDCRLEDDLYSSFTAYQADLLKVFGELVQQYKIQKIDARGTEAETYAQLRDAVMAIIDSPSGVTS